MTVSNEDNRITSITKDPIEYGRVLFSMTLGKFSALPRRVDMYGNDLGFSQLDDYIKCHSSGLRLSRRQLIRRLIDFYTQHSETMLRLLHYGFHWIDMKNFLLELREYCPEDPDVKQLFEIPIFNNLKEIENWSGQYFYSLLQKH